MPSHWIRLFVDQCFIINIMVLLFVKVHGLPTIRTTPITSNNSMDTTTLASTTEEPEQVFSLAWFDYEPFTNSTLVDPEGDIWDLSGIFAHTLIEMLQECAHPQTKLKHVKAFNNSRELENTKNANFLFPVTWSTSKYTVLKEHHQLKFLQSVFVPVLETQG